MKKNTYTRRQALAATGAGVIGTMAASMGPVRAFDISHPKKDKLAINGGDPVRDKEWPAWPVWDQAAEEGVISMLRTGNWWRGDGGHVEEFEKKYAQLLGANHCVATSSGTTALQTALQVLGVDDGDEVIVSPYTFIASYNVIFLNKALPVFVDTNPETFLIDTDKIEERITDRTTALLPVHIFGMPVEMDKVNAIAKKKGLKVVEDACQAWLSEYKGKKAGTLGDLGCFSFQNSKHLPSGEGGAIVGADENLLDRCYALHNSGRGRGTFTGDSPIFTRGSNRRMQQIQGLILMSQMKRLEADSEKRWQNAKYLDERLAEIPGIIPCKMTAGATKSSYHLYPFRYKKEEFNDVSRSTFLKALSAEGISNYSGYGPQYKYGIMDEALNSRGYKRLYGEKRLKQYREELVFPGNDQLCEEAVCLFQNMLLGSKQDMDDIVNAIKKIHDNKGKLAG